MNLKKRQELFHKNHSIFLGYGRDVNESYKPDGNRDEIEIWVPEGMRKQHTLIIGTTGSGKTVLLSNLAKQDILGGRRVCYIDPKGDEDLFRTFVSAATLTGRFNPETFMFLSPMYLDQSIELNPLWGLDPDEAATVLASAIPDGKEPFFKKVAFMVLLAIMLAKASNNPTPNNYPSILEIAEYFSLDRLKNLEEMVREILEDVKTAKDPKLASYAEDASLVLSHLTASGKDYFEKISTTLKSEIDVLVTGAIGQVIGKAKTNRLVERLGKGEDVIFLAYLGALRFGDEIVGRAARMIFSSLQRLTGKMYERFQRFTPPLSVYGDESKNLLYVGIEDLFNKVRGANMMLTFATQSLGDIVAAIGQEKLDQITGNTNTQIFMRATDKFTMDYVENSASMVSVSEAIYVNHSLGLTTRPERLIKGPDLNQLGAGAFYSRIDGLWYQLYTPFEKFPEHLDFNPAEVLKK